MTVGDEAERHGQALRISYEFDAPPERVYREWTSAEAMRAWFAPEGYDVLAAEVDARPGGKWCVRYSAPGGSLITEHGEFVTLEPWTRIDLTLIQSFAGQPPGPETRISVRLTDLGGRTRMDFVQTGIRSDEEREGMASGWRTCIEKLVRHLVESQEDQHV